MIYLTAPRTILRVGIARKRVSARAVPRLQIIGSPRGAAEKFDAKRVIGAAFFFDRVRIGLRFLQPDCPACY